jgi:hypothetical protein
MLEFLDWLYDKLNDGFDHPIFSAAVIGLILGMSAVEFTARMLPANTPPSIATRVSWFASCAVAFVVAFSLNQTLLGFSIAITAAVAAPSLQIGLMRAAYLRWPDLKPMAMRENPPAPDRPSDVHWP